MAGNPKFGTRFNPWTAKHPTVAIRRSRRRSGGENAQGRGAPMRRIDELLPFAYVPPAERVVA